MEFHYQQHDPDEPVTALTDEMLIYLIERGSFQDWQPLLEEIINNPDSDFVDRLDGLLPYVDSAGAPEFFRLKILDARGQHPAQRVVVDRIGGFEGV
ncbi:hypothetical protein ACNQR7_30840 [Mycolicibacterium senegalense]|uniref:hypothetical protein n=1 Tax=Mycolicibacterium senegalense TaxID=1796 RepID=UPI003AAE45C2